MPEAEVQPKYEPVSRRPIAGMFRATAHFAVRLCLRLGIHPDAVSYLSIVASAGAAACFWKSGESPWLLIPAAGLCYVRLWLNMLDGMVALASGRASPRGEILNDLPDRVSDVLVFTGVAHSGLASPFVAYWAAILALLTAYVGVLGQAAGAHREFSGVMSKPWRMVALSAGAAAMFVALQWQSHPTFARLTLLDWTCLIVVIGCVETIAVR